MKKICNLIFFLFVFFLLSCTSRKETKKKTKVIVSIPPYEYLVKEVAGDTLEVSSIIGQSQSPHFFEPTFKDIEKIDSAKIWFTIGEMFESKIISALNKKNNTLSVVDLKKNVNLIKDSKCKCSAAFVDNHIWLSPKSIKPQIDTIYLKLIEDFPENAKVYKANYNSLIEKIAALDKKIEKRLSKSKTKAFITSHSAYGYFCRDYNIIEISIEHDGKSPTSKHLLKVLNDAKKYKIDKIFIQKQYNNRGAQIIAKKLSKRVFMIDPYSIKYEDTMNRFIKSLTDDSKDE